MQAYKYAFTQRHYITVAKVLVDNGQNSVPLIEAFVDIFEKDSDRFKPELFKKACAYSEEVAQ